MEAGGQEWRDEDCSINHPPAQHCGPEANRTAVVARSPRGPSHVQRGVGWDPGPPIGNAIHSRTSLTAAASRLELQPER
jgi:hypothetical protein